ncbi:MAG: hypothetical protein AB7V48_00390 [Sedimentibacter sp.]
MMLFEYLNQLSVDELCIIAENLHCIDAKDQYKFHKKEYRDRIYNELSSKYIWDIVDKGTHPAHLKEYEIEDLKNLCFEKEKIGVNSLNRFREIGIIDKYNNILDDIRKCLIGKWRLEFTKALEDMTICVNPSVFLRLILILGFIEKDKIQTYEELTELKFANRDIIIKIKEYLQNQDLIICREDAIIELNYQKVNTWRCINPIKSFYNYYFDKRDLKISECLYKIGEIQQNDREWISVNKANFIVKKYFAEIKFLESIGCLLVATESTEEYFQLSPEMRYIISEKIPLGWSNDNIIVTPDFEVFVPFYYNPLEIYDINYYGELNNRKFHKLDNNKNLKKKNKVKEDRRTIDINYGNDFYLIYEIKDFKNKINKLRNCEQLIRCLGSNIPDVVLYEIRKQSFKV